MDLIVKKIRVDNYKRKFAYEYELWSDRKQSLFRKEMLLGLSFVVSVQIIPIELEEDLVG